MGRTMPAECPHGYIYDWGDFGNEDNDTPPEPCPTCDADRLKKKVYLHDHGAWAIGCTPRCGWYLALPWQDN